MKRWKSAAASVAVLSFFGAASSAQAAIGPGGAVITCTVKFNDPHNSGHVGGQVNAVVTTSCTSPVNQIQSFIGLYDTTHGRYNPSGGSTTYGSNRNSGQSNLSCINGSYYSKGSVTVYFPANYKPTVLSTEGVSKTIGINCSGAMAAPASRTITFTATEKS